MKIAVPVGKMAVEDLEYVERATGVSLDEDKPLSDIKRRSTLREKERQASRSQNGISTANAPEYDWFDFFLACGVNPQICERYAQIFSKDQMGEENLPDVTPALLRTLGLKEGDILRVMKYLDQKFGRTDGTPGEGDAASGGLFSGPGGALKNNTRKGRPAPAVSTNDVISAEGLKAQNATDASRSVTPVQTPASPGAPPPPPKNLGFDDDAWSVKPVKSPASQTQQAVAPPPKEPSPAPAAAAAAPTLQAPKLTGSMNDLSLLSPALEPTRTGPSPQPSAPAAVAAPPAQEPAKPAADPAFFDKLGTPAQQNILSQATGRARPQAPAVYGSNPMLAPPPRAASAPGFQQPQQQSGFAMPAPLSAQMTGYQQPMQTGFQAPPGQSLQALQSQQQFQQQQQMPYQQGMMMPQQTGYQPMMAPQMTGFYPQQHFMQQQPTASPFADSARISYQPTGFQQQPQFPSQPGMLPAPLTPMRTGASPINGFGAPPQLQAQQTGFQPQSQFGQQQQQQQQQYGMMPPQQLPPGYPPQQLPPQQTGMTNGFGGGAPMQPLQPQKTGPAPPVSFGTSAGIKPLIATPTGRRANLSNASKLLTLYTEMDSADVEVQRRRIPLGSKPRSDYIGPRADYASMRCTARVRTFESWLPVSFGLRSILRPGVQ